MEDRRTLMSDGGPRRGTPRLSREHNRNFRTLACIFLSHHSSTPVLGFPVWGPHESRFKKSPSWEVCPVGVALLEFAV